MDVGFIGLGKLGLPCAVAAEQIGRHRVIGYDVSSTVKGYVQQRSVPYQEERLDELLLSTELEFAGSISEVVDASDLVFIAVQTPHHPEFEGTTPLPSTRKDFEYGYLLRAVRDAASACDPKRSPTFAVISTVSPGTMAQHVVPQVHSGIDLAYNPYFIAMGTTIPDFLAPEFVLIGSQSESAVERLKQFYAVLHDAPVVATSFESAELIKMAYNTFIGMKIVFANTLMEICHKSGADVDVVTETLALANSRLLSPRYMSGGMGDGGGCHPRDQLVMSFLAQRLSLSFDLFEVLMSARDRQTEWLAGVVKEWHELTNLPIVILGKAYKPETNISVGSPSALLAHFLGEVGLDPSCFDPLVDDTPPPLFSGPRIYVVATKHKEFEDYAFPTDSIVIDPWGYIPDRDGTTTIRIGRN